MPSKASDSDEDGGVLNGSMSAFRSSRSALRPVDDPELVHVAIGTPGRRQLVRGTPSTLVNRESERDNVLAASQGPPDDEWFAAVDDRFGQGRIRRIVRHVPLAAKIANKIATLMGDMVANGAAEHRVLGLKCVEDRVGCYRGRNFEGDLRAGPSQVAQMVRQGNSDFGPCHGNVCTSTDNTLGRSRTIVVQ